MDRGYEEESGRTAAKTAQQGDQGVLLLGYNPVINFLQPYEGTEHRSTAEYFKGEF